MTLSSTDVGTFPLGISLLVFSSFALCFLALRFITRKYYLTFSLRFAYLYHCFVSVLNISLIICAKHDEGYLALCRRIACHVHRLCDCVTCQPECYP